ncbi:unnamed protein product, partial [Mesorhabditis belari]|uniref:Helicase domino n=1 Tax=Mesorhabditis belari TaxID=2138241 RepID=A0AAF3J1H4_9BILA
MLRRSAAGSIAVNDEDPSCSNMAQPEEGIPLENEVISRLLYQVRDNRDQRERLFQRRIKDGSEPTCELAEPVNQTVQQIELSFCGTVFEDLLKSEESEIQKRLVKKKRRDEIVVPKLEKLTINVDAPSSSSAPLSECLLAVGTILPGTVSNIERAARREAHVMARVAELKRQGLWSSNLLPLCVEPQRKTTHWDNLLKEVVYLAHEFKTERKYKKKIASKFVRGAMKRWQELDKKEELALEKDKKHAMKSCAAVAKIVKDFWAKVNKVVDAKAKNVIESRKRRALNNQLTMLIDKADKLSSIVGDGLQQSATPSVNSDVVADQEYSESDTSSDNEDTFVNAERNCTEEDVAQELDALQKDSVVEFDDFLSSLPPEYLKMLMENQKNEQNLEKTVEPGPIKEVKQEVTSKKDNSISSKRAELENLADEAMLFQPKGFSLKTTQIKTPVPPLMRGTLREYQIVGLDWLVTLYEKNLNGILADEMGLGKTIQTIALLAHLACAKYNWGPHLIIVPTSVILNWEMEFKRWCPALKIFTYYGSAKERKLKRKGWSKENAFHVCITSYKTVTTDIRIFKMKKWQYMVLDEAQNIKNFKSQRWQALLNVRSANRLLLTGTPLQNSLMELWSLMHFLMPELFASHDDFKEWFSNPLTDMMEGNVEYNAPLVRRLHQILRPFILRRLKGEVEKQLPKKTEKVIKCSLSKRQRYLYDDFMSQRSTRESLKSGNMMSVLNIIMQLRKCCNHPNLFEPRPVVSPFSFFGGSMTLPGCIMELLDQRIPLSLDLRDRMLGWNTKGISHNFYTKESRNKNSKPPLALEFFYSREVRTHPPKTIPKCSWHPISIPKIPGFRFVRAIPDKLPTAVMPPQGSLQITAANQNLGLKKRKRFAGIEDGDEENQKEPKEEGQSISTEPNPSAEEGVPAKRCKRRRGQKRHATKLLRQKEKGDSFDLAFRELIPRGAVKRIFEEREHQRQLLQANNLTDPLLYNELRCLLRNEIMPVASRYVCDLIAGKTLTKIMDERIGQDLQRVHFTVPNALCYESRTLPSPGCSSFYYHNELLQREACRFVMNDVKERDHALIANQRMLLPELRLIEYDCGKLQVLSQLLRQLYLYKHRVLIFTQMARMLDVLQAFLSFHGYQYFRLDGSTGVEQRHAMMERFNTDERIFCFILSTRSGGVGINLTGADTVIFYDSDWNPTMDAQAQDRCHRIGQTRHVAVYRLISERTIEENILKKAMQKRRLGEIAIDEAGFTPEFFKKPDNLRDLFEDETIKEAIPEEIVIPRDQQELNKAMAKCEDEQDVLAIRELQAEVKAEKAEFELIASGADLSQLDETTRDDDDYKELLDKLSPIECYAIRFLQEDKRSFYDTQLEEAEKELEQKNVETKTRLKGLVTTMEASHDDESMTFQADTLIDELLFNGRDFCDELPIWLPPSPPNSDVDELYANPGFDLMYEIDWMHKEELPLEILDFYRPLEKYQRLANERDRDSTPTALSESSLLDVLPESPIPIDEVFGNSPIPFMDQESSVDGVPIESANQINHHAMNNTEAAVNTILEDALEVIKHSSMQPMAAQRMRNTSRQVASRHPDLRRHLTPPPLQREQGDYDGPPWTDYEDKALLQGIGTQERLTHLPSTSQTINWDFVAGIVKMSSNTYRSPKQCFLRYLYLSPMEEMRTLSTIYPRLQNKNLGFNGESDQDEMRNDPMLEKLHTERGAFIYQGMSQKMREANKAVITIAHLSRERRLLMPSGSIVPNDQADRLRDYDVNYEETSSPLVLLAIKEHRRGTMANERRDHYSIANSLQQNAEEDREAWGREMRVIRRPAAIICPQDKINVAERRIVIDVPPLPKPVPTLFETNRPPTEHNVANQQLARRVALAPHQQLQQGNYTVLVNSNDNAINTNRLSTYAPNTNSGQQIYRTIAPAAQATARRTPPQRMPVGFAQQGNGAISPYPGSDVQQMRTMPQTVRTPQQPGQRVIQRVAPQSSRMYVGSGAPVERHAIVVQSTPPMRVVNRNTQPARRPSQSSHQLQQPHQQQQQMPQQQQQIAMLIQQRGAQGAGNQIRNMSRFPNQAPGGPRVTNVVTMGHPMTPQTSQLQMGQASQPMQRNDPVMQRQIQPQLMHQQNIQISRQMAPNVRGSLPTVLNPISQRQSPLTVASHDSPQHFTGIPSTQPQPPQPHSQHLILNQPNMPQVQYRSLPGLLPPQVPPSVEPLQPPVTQPDRTN